MKKLLLILALLVPSAAWSQGARWDGITFSPSGRPMSANVAVCSSPGLTTTAAQVIGNTAILTMASNPITAGFAANQQIVISGFTGGDTYFNVGVVQPFSTTVTITNVSATTITFPLTHANASAATNGSVLQQGNISIGCAPIAAIYTDAALTNLITQPGFVSSGIGNVGFYLNSGSYIVQFYGPGVTTYTQPIVVVGTTSASLPNGSVQFDNSGVLGGTVFIYNPANTATYIGGNPCNTSGCATITTAVESGMLLRSTDATNTVSFSAQSDVAPPSTQAGATVIANSQVTHGPLAQGFISQSLVGGTTLNGSCFGGGIGSPPCARSYISLFGDVGSNASNGQDAVGFNAHPSMNKSVGHNLNSMAGFLVSTPLNDLGGGVAVTETAVNLWGLEIQDLQDLGSTMTAGIHIEAQTNPTTHGFAVKEENGAGPNVLTQVWAGGAAAGLTGTGACATFSNQVGGAWAGSAKCTAATAASTLTITPGTTAPNGWSCSVQDETTRANLFQQTSHTQTSCTLTITSVTQNDVFVFTATGF